MLWKMLEGDAETPMSHHDDSKWTVGEWRDVTKEWEKEWGWTCQMRVAACDFGFHCSPTLVEAFMFVEPGVIALVEVDGDSDYETDSDEYDEMWLPLHKSAHERMRLVRVWEWTEDDYKALVEEMARYEDVHGHEGRYYSFNTLLQQYHEGNPNRWQNIASYMLDRRISQDEWDHINKWWEHRLTRLG